MEFTEKRERTREIFPRFKNFLRLPAMSASAVFFVCFVICCLGTAVQNKQAFEERATALQGGGKALERTDGETLLCVEMRKNS